MRTEKTAKEKNHSQAAWCVSKDESHAYGVVCLMLRNPLLEWLLGGGPNAQWTAKFTHTVSLLPPWAVRSDPKARVGAAITVCSFSRLW